MQIALAVEVPLYLVAGWRVMPWNSLGFHWDLMNLLFMAIWNTDLTPQSCDFTVKNEFERSHKFTAVVLGNFNVLIFTQRIKSVVPMSAFRDTKQKVFHSDVWFHSDSISLKAKQTVRSTSVLFGVSGLLSGAQCDQQASFFIPFPFHFILNRISNLFTHSKIFEPSYLYLKWWRNQRESSLHYEITVSCGCFRSTLC